MQLFSVNKKTNEIEIKAELLLLKAVSDLKKRDTSKGKKKHLKELAAVYFLCSYQSPIVQQYKVANRLPQVIEKLGLPKNWKPDEKVREMIKLYNEIQNSAPSIRIINELRQSLNISADVISVQRRDLEEQLDELEKEKNNSESRVLSNQLLSAIDRLIAIGNKIPESIRKIKDLEEQIKRELDDNAVNVVGGGDVGMFEDPQ